MKVMRHVLKLHSIVIVLAGVLSVTLMFGQSEKDSQRQRTLQHDASAVIKLVTVRVLDQDGRPVIDLQKEDFILYDNGEKKVITEFEVHTLSEAGMEVRSSDQKIDLAEAVKGMNRRLFIFLDIQGSDVNGMANAKKAAVHFVDTQLRPGDEVGILGFSPMKGFFIQEYLTTDHKKIRRAIEKTRDIEVKPSEGFFSGGGGESTSEVLKAFGLGSQSIWFPGSAIFHRRDFTPRISDLAQALRYIPGNKSLIFFTGRNLGPVATKLGKEFASASTPVYTVNTRNWIVKRIMRLSIKKKYIWEDHPLKEMALASGGKYFADIKDVETISREVQVLTGNFYVLGYYVNETWDGKYHQIKVEVKKPDLRVLAQHGYFNPKLFAELTDFEKQLHLYDLVFTEDPAILDPMDIPIEPLFITGIKDINCALLSQIAVNERTGIPPSKVEIFAFLFNMDHKEVMKKKGEIDLTPFDQKTLFPYFTTKLPAGDYECRIVIRDLRTGQAAIGKTVFRLPEKSDTENVLSSPLLFATGPESQILKFSDKDISISDFYKFQPKNHCLIVRELEPGIKRLLALLPVSVHAGLTPEVELSVRLYPKPEGEPTILPTEIVDVKKTSTNTDIFMIEIRLPDLKPGKYELEIEALDEQSLARYFIRKFLVRAS